MIKLRPGQIEVAGYREGYLAVPAVPGAGKTTVLAYLAANLIEGGFTNQGKILIVTYMNSAVSNFRNRIGDYLADRGLSRNRGYEVRTLHSLALNILKEKPEELMINSEFNIIDPRRKGRLIRELVEEWLRDNQAHFMCYFDYDSSKYGYQQALERWQDHFPRFIATMIGHLKIQGLTGDKAKELLGVSQQNSYLEWSLQIFIEYERTLHHQGLLDFDDLIIKACNLLKQDQQLLARLQKKYSYVFEDEAQDSNLLLGEILSMLAGDEGNLVRVGDSNQAIMGTFTAADPGLFRAYSEEPRIDKRSILYSSRSTKDIINLANYLVKWSREEHPLVECREALEEKMIYPVPADDPFPNPETAGYTIHTHCFKRSSDEIGRVSREAARHARENPDSTVAILVPTNFIIENVIEELEQVGAEFECLSDQLADQVKIINDLKKIIYFLAEPNKEERFLALIVGLLMPDNDKESNFLDFLSRLLERYGVEELIYPIGGEERIREYTTGQMSGETLLLLKESLTKLQLWLAASVNIPPDELILFLAEQMELKNEELAIAQNMALQVKMELELNPRWKLHEIADELPRLQDSFQQFARNIYERKGFEPRPGVVTVTTMHKAKGLEWDTLYLSYLTADYYPSLLSDKFKGDLYYIKDEFSNPEAIARARLAALLDIAHYHNPIQEAKIETIKERLRLLYVGITRARKNLLLTAHREMVYDSGYSKKVNPSRVYMALREYIHKERSNYESK